MSARYVVDLRELDRTQIATAGGKAANLGELSRIEGIRVPPGFVVTTAAFRRAIGQARAPKEIAMPGDVGNAIVQALSPFGPNTAFAVRSSATTEDSPSASFAGQYETYLNVVGAPAVLEHVRRCWASLFSDRAVAYRQQKGIDERAVAMAVIVQQMVAGRASGILFTVHPVTGHRTIVTVEAVMGLGESLVSGLVNADRYAVRGTQIDSTVVNDQPVLTREEVVQLAELGRRIESHFGQPQDIEWCLVGNELQFVQTRPITTLFPVPETRDPNTHVYLSVGHQQMMTDAMKPLGISLWQMTTPRPMAVAGGRLFVDVTQTLSSPATREGLLSVMGKSDPLMRDALQTLLDRADFIKSLPDPAAPAMPPGVVPPPPLETDPSIVTSLIRESEESIAALKRDIAGKSGAALFDFIQSDLEELRRILFNPRSTQVFMTAMHAIWWLNDHMQQWLGEKNAADTLTLSVPNNVTSEMGLALLDVADAIRPHPQVVAFLERVKDDRFLDDLAAVSGGRQARDAIEAWLEEYGMRGVGEIDITRPRWSERPSMLLPLILGHVRNAKPGEAKRRFEGGRQEAELKARELLARLRSLPDGEAKAAETQQMIDRVRTFIGYREYPKYGMISRYFVYKRALLEEAERLVRDRVIREQEDIFYLGFDELRDVARTRRADEALIRERKAAFASYRALRPPRVLTSEGEGITGDYRRADLPNGALAGLPVSAGVAEGRARVVLEMEGARFEPGDILVTAFTDPSWTSAFVSIAGVVTEVGGLMTHGAVIAREYGLPAVVGVEGATRLLRDGQRIRVHGTDGYVEIL